MLMTFSSNSSSNQCHLPWSNKCSHNEKHFKYFKIISAWLHLG
uniref:Uncharacterized protein n=1 Tax=Anguilla anguilla TaxID=7936 RepID=A0A0E9WBN3_ANGAN